MSEKINPEDACIFVRCPDGRLELRERLDKTNLETWTNHWKDNYEYWSEDTRYENLREFLKIEGFEEWYKEYKLVPTYNELLEVYRNDKYSKSLSFQLYDEFTDEQKIKFYNKMKEKQK